MKNILLMVHDDVGQEARLQASLDVARAVGGHLTCIDITVMPAYAGDYLSADSLVILLDEEREREAENRQRLEARLVHEDVPWNWVDMAGTIGDCIGSVAGLADLIVLNRRLDAFPMPEMLPVATDLLIQARKPLLAVPDDAKGCDVNGHALVAWDGSDASLKAVQAAAPLLRFADSVTIIEVDDGSLRNSVEEAAAYLSRHDVHPRIERIPADNEPAGAILLDKAGKEGVAYLVMGGFSHSRFREALFGGVTRMMLTKSPVPLFMAH